MDLKELLEFIAIEDKRLDKYYDHLDKSSMILARTVKLSEELGEFCEEVLAHNSLQRSQKMDNHDKAGLSEEFADVIITALLTAKSLNIDIEEALKNKVEKINKRY